MKLGLENKKQTMWAAILGAIAILYGSYQFLPLIMGGPTDASSSAQAAGPAAVRVTTRQTGKGGKKVRPESLDPTLRLDLLASSEQTEYKGNGRNIFVSQAEDIVIQKPMGTGVTDAKKEDPKWQPPIVPTAPPIPLKFFGFASQPGEPKKIFLSQGEDVWVAAEGEIVNRRYKVIRINTSSVEMQDVVNSGPSQTIPLTQG